MLSAGLTTIGTGGPRLWINGDLTPDELQVVQDVKAESGRKQFRRGQCFRNAQMLAITDVRLAYVEGVAGRGTHHAWNAINGKVVDVTWKDVRGPVAYLGFAFDQSAVRDRWVTAPPRSLVTLALLGAREISALLKALEALDEPLAPA